MQITDHGSNKSGKAGDREELPQEVRVDRESERVNKPQIDCGWTGKSVEVSLDQKKGMTGRNTSSLNEGRRRWTAGRLMERESEGEKRGRR
jgi:hypothetical protein